MTAYNQPAINAFAKALASGNTAAAIEGAVSQYMRQWSAHEVQTKIYPNGLAKVQVLDKDFALIGEYTRPAKSVFVQHQYHGGNVLDEKINLQCLVEYAGNIERCATEDQSEDVFGPDARTVLDRREGMARQLRQLADLAIKLASAIESN